MLALGDATQSVLDDNDSPIGSMFMVEFPSEAEAKNFSANDPYAKFKQGFELAKALVAADAISKGATDGGAFAVAEAYHVTLAAPFCFAAAKSFIASH